MLNALDASCRTMTTQLLKVYHKFSIHMWQWIIKNLWAPSCVHNEIDGILMVWYPRLWVVFDMHGAVAMHCSVWYLLTTM